MIGCGCDSGGGVGGERKYGGGGGGGERKYGGGGEKRLFSEEREKNRRGEL